MWLLQESTHVPSAMNSPSRHIPIRTVIVAAKVVDRFIRIEDHASENNSRTLLTCVPPARRSFGGVASAALVAGQPAVLERDHALAHLVDHLAVVGDHE